MHNYKQDDIIFGRHFIISFTYNFQKLKTRLEDYINNIEEDEWELIAQKIGRIALWEFEDYKT
jgi:hypothetical protein